MLSIPAEREHLHKVGFSKKKQKTTNTNNELIKKKIQ